MTRTGGVLLLSFAVAAGGCDHFQANPFAGSRMQITMSGARPTPAGQHLELWARDGANTIVRVLSGSVPDNLTAPNGLGPGQVAYTIVPTVEADDPCMIDRNGHLLTDPAAVRTGETDPQGDAGAMAVKTRIDQLTKGAAPMLSLVGYDDQTPKRPTIPADAAPADRLAMCLAWWGRPSFDSPPTSGRYTGDPLQLTSPVNGELFGMLDYQAIAPAPGQIVGGIQIISDFSLHDLRELWFTQTAATVEMVDPDVVDCAAHADTCRGGVFLQGTAGPSDRGIFRMELSAPGGGPQSGSASVYTRLDEDPVQF